MRDKGRQRWETTSEQNEILLRGNFNARAERASLKLNRNIWTGFEVNMCNFKGLRWVVMLLFFLKTSSRWTPGTFILHFHKVEGFARKKKLRGQNQRQQKPQHPNL